MRTLRFILPGLALLALTATGCFITSAQVFVKYPFSNFTIDSSTNQSARIDVDLNTIEEYSDHKDDLKGLADLAVVGTFTNVSGPAGGVEVWITPGTTSYTTVSEITTNGTRLWGPATIGASGTPEATRTIGWDDSAALFDPDGKAILLQETKGDGAFTLYTIGTAGTYDIQVTDAFLILTLNAGV